MARSVELSSNNLAKVLFLKVGKGDAESSRRLLIRNDLLNFRVSIISDNDFVCFPLIDGIYEDHILTLLCNDAKEQDAVFARDSISFSNKIVPLIEKKPSDFREIIEIPGSLRGNLPSSWDVVGNIILVKLQDEILPFKDKIASALLDTHKSIDSVYRVGKVSGDRRIRELEHIGGKDNTETSSKEFGIRLSMDVGKVYYSPRLATERWRIVQQVNDGEKILDMFAGVGPFSLVISRHTRAEVIHSVDINPIAIRYLERNIGINRAGNVIPHLGDAVEVCAEFGEEIKFDRIIMNLPHSSVDFLPGALECSKEGTVIHLYIIDSIEKVDHIIANCLEMVKELGYRIAERKRVVIKSYSPVDINICSDISVMKVPDCKY